MIRIDLKKADILSGYPLHQNAFRALHLPLPERIDASAAAYLQRQLGPAELKKYRKLFRNPRRQQLVLFSRFFAKWLAADYSAETGNAVVLPPQLSVMNRENGIPRICGLPDGVQMNLSVSYAQDSVLIGCAAEEKIGVDLENRLDPDSELPSLVLSRQERALMNSSLFGCSREQLLLLFWCLKEAILKAVGLGFTRGYLPIEFHTDPGRTQLFLADHQAVIPAGEQLHCLYDMNDSLCAVICRIGKEVPCD